MAVTEEQFQALASMVDDNPLLDACFPPTDDNDLHRYIKHHYGFALPRVAVCAGHIAPFEALADAFFGRVLNAIWVGPRTGGKTLQFAILDHLMMKHYATTIANVGAIEEQAKKCYGYIRDFLALAQFRDDVRGESLMSVTTLNNGGRVEIMPATMNRVNSPHPERAHWDEIELTAWTILQEGSSFSSRTKVTTTQGEKAISCIKGGDIVECRLNGKQTYRRVVWTGATGRGRIIRIALSNGRTLEVTASHEILTPQGWRAAQTLTIGDRLVPGLWGRDVRQKNVVLSTPQADDRGGGLWLPPSVRVESSEGRGARGCFTSDGLPSHHLMGCSQAVLGDDDHGSVRVIGIAEGAIEPVFDIGVEEAHNFVAEGVVVHNSMPVRTNGRPPATIFTSTRKRAYGTMERLLEEADERGLVKNFWCIWEIAAECPPERHHFGAPTGCGSCKLQEVCRERATDEYGVEHYLPGPGKAARSRGWMPIEDVIQKFISMDRAVFDAQWLSLRPETSGLAYPMFDPAIHVIDYEYNPTYPVVCGIDYGFTNPSVAVYAQPTPNDDVVIFAEDYQAGRTADEFAHSITKAQWFRNTAWRVADHDSGDSATLRAFGVETEPANKHSQIMNLPNVIGGISVVRWALKPMGRRKPILYISRKCVNLIKEMKKYHHPDEKDDRDVDERPVKKDDHACDATRYMLVRLYRGMLNV